MLIPHPCSEFLNQFLATRNLTQPTGKALYGYKASRAEYESLKTLLSTAPPAVSTSACFVLFAAEWWRRNYAGGHWEWEPIFNEINQPGWEEFATRKALTTQGLHYWKRSVFQRANGDRAYLGSVFVEAGLPVGVLLNPGSHIRELVMRSFEQRQACQSEDSLGPVREVARNLNLADSLQTDAFYDLVGQVVSGLLSLKKDYQLAQQPDPLAYLQQHVPDWQERLPLWLDHDARAGAFLGELLVETARIPRRDPVKITVTYRLVQVGDAWRVRAVLCIPDGRHPADALSLTQDEFAQLPDKVSIKIVTTHSERRLDYAFKNGDGLSIRGLTNVDLPNGVATEPWQLVVANAHNEPVATIPLPYSDGLPAGLPWIFAQNEAGDWMLKGTGSVRLRAGRARVVCARSLHWPATDEARTYVGDLSDNQVIYEIDASVRFHDPLDDQAFQIRLTESTDEPYVYMLLPEPGNRQITYFPQLHRHVYVGFPRLFRVHTPSGTRSPVSRNRIAWRTSSTWEPLLQTETRCGRFKIRIADADGAVVYSQEIAVLPLNFTICIDQKNPAVVLCQSAPFSVSVYMGEADLSAQIGREGNGHRITLLRDNERDRIRIRLMSSASQAIDLYVPFPAANGYFTDKANGLLPRDSQLSIRGIHGNGLLVNNVEPTEKIHDLVFRLEGCHTPPALVEIRRQVRLKPFSAELIPLLRFQDVMRKLLSYADSVDAKVRVSVPTFPISPRLWITQHTGDTAFDQATRTIRLNDSLPAGQTLDLRAFRLDEPFGAENCLRLETVADGWVFPQSCRGKWFYYAAPDSVGQIRPKVAVLETTMPDERETVTAVWEAANLSYQNRQVVLRQLFDTIACEFKYADWTALDALYEHTKHLPLQALDAWKALILSDGGLVCFFLRSILDRLDRFTDEFSINWYRIPVRVWQQGVDAYYRHLCELGLSGTGAEFVIESKLTELERGFGFGSLAQILRISSLGQPASPDFSFISRFPTIARDQLTDSIMGQRGNPGLINRHHGYKFPVDLAEELKSCLRQLPQSVRHLLPDLTAQPYIRPLVYLPAVLAYQSVCPDCIDIGPLAPHLVTKLIDFDPDHFYFFFNLIQSFCWQTPTQ